MSGAPNTIEKNGTQALTNPPLPPSDRSRRAVEGAREATRDIAEGTMGGCPHSPLSFESGLRQHVASTSRGPACPDHYYSFI
eukprot:gene15607-biopygen6686